MITEEKKKYIVVLGTVINVHYSEYLQWMV